ncbi:MAG TPA: hypothetical protein VFV70_07415 [Hyphomonadaceae bacterium]|nr:hypothetical protein [Hyphomonadaceae bacterium]
MKHSFIRRLAFATLMTLAVSALAAPVVFAQLKPAPSAAGSWTFKTGQLRGDCDISGDMLIRETAKNAFSCTFKAVQVCRGRLPHAIHTEQSCIATQKGDAVVITSKVDKIVSVDPKELMEGMDRLYAADNFKVTINRRGDQMEGRFESLSTALVKFQRQQDLVS